MRFIVDTQLPAKLAHYITSLGYQTVHTTFYENCKEGRESNNYKRFRFFE